jgi:hypothetical protein
MTNKVLFFIFAIGIVAGFFLAGFGDNEGIMPMFWIGLIIAAVAVVAWRIWWNNPDRK